MRDSNITGSHFSQHICIERAQLTCRWGYLGNLSVPDSPIRLLSPLQGDSIHSFLLHSVLELRDTHGSHCETSSEICVICWKLALHLLCDHCAQNHAELKRVWCLRVDVGDLPFSGALLSQQGRSDPQRSRPVWSSASRPACVLLLIKTQEERN